MVTTKLQTLLLIVSILTNYVHSTGHLMLFINDHFSFILCSTNIQDDKKSLVSLVNINDVLNNAICQKTSKFDFSSHQLLFDQQTSKILKATKNIKQTNSDNTIEIESISSNNVYLKQNNEYLSIELVNEQIPIPISPNSPKIVLSKSKPVLWTFVDIEQSPFSNKKHFTTIDSESPNSEEQLQNDENIENLKIGKRVNVDNKTGIITNYLISDATYFIDFDDGTSAFYDETQVSKFANILSSHYPIGSQIDAYWPPDRLKLTDLRNVLWPGIVKNYSNMSDSYEIQFEDGQVHPLIPSMWVKYPSMACVDDRSDCALLALNNECRTNPSFAMIFCRKSCRVCTAKNDETMEEKERNNLKYFDVSINKKDIYGFEDDIGLFEYAYNEISNNRVNEAISLNKMGEELMLFGNITLAEEYFLRASFLGNNNAKFNLGHVYSILGEDEMAVLYFYFASIAGSLEANLALGYRHLKGYGVPKTCEIAAKYYEKAANALFGFGSASFNPISEQQNIELIRLSDVQRRDTPMSESDDVIRFYHSHADQGDAHAQMALGQLYYYGLRGFDQDIHRAMQYFELAAAQNSGDAYGMLANVYVDGVEDLNIAKDIAKAIEYYEKAIKLKSVYGFTGLAFLHLEGIPSKADQGKLIKNTTKAYEYFGIAAKSGDVSATFYLGLMHFTGIGVKRKSFEKAFDCFMAASRRGHAQSLYYAGYMHLKGLVTAKSCKMAVELFKMAAERTKSANAIGKARSYYLDSNYDQSFYLYSKSSVQGFEIAQSNAGWLLARNLVNRHMIYDYLTPSNESNMTEGETDETLKKVSLKSAFKYFEWSASQNNPDSQRMVGDYYFYNYLDVANGTDYNEAANYYQMSSENILNPNAQSMFNLGYMHFIGMGRQKDFEMAKRYFDLSKQTAQDGSIACYIALAYLFIERFYNDFYNGNVLNTYFGNWYISNALISVEYYYQRYIASIDSENALLFVLCLTLFFVLWYQTYRRNN